MAAFDELYREIKTLPGGVGQDALKQSLLKVAMRQVKASAFLKEGEAYWLSLDGILWLMLRTCRNRDATQKQRKVGLLVQRAIDELERIQ